METNTDRRATYEDLRAAFEIWEDLATTDHHKSRDLDLVFSFLEEGARETEVVSLEYEPSQRERAFFAAREQVPHEVRHNGYVADGEFRVASCRNETPYHTGIRTIERMINSILPWTNVVLADIAAGESEWDDEQESFAKKTRVAQQRIRKLRQVQ